MTDFSNLERRVKDECNKVGEQKSFELERTIGRLLGYNPDAGTWWASEEYLDALKPLREFAKKRFSNIEFNRVWHEAEKAAIATLKKEMK